ncbi:MAG: hypothetical protein ACRYFW_00155 [Janthinobacterium lividum]
MEDTAFTLGQATALALGYMRPARTGWRGPRPSGAPHRTGTLVRRGSIEAGTFEEAFTPSQGKSETDRLLKMARQYQTSLQRSRS